MLHDMLNPNKILLFIGCLWLGIASGNGAIGGGLYCIGCAIINTIQETRDD